MTPVLIVIVLSLAIALIFVWAMRFHFSSPETPLGAIVIFLAGLVGSLYLAWLTWWADPPALPLIVGSIIEIGSLALFFAAIVASREAKLRFVFDPAHPHSLVQAGPYRWVRHPFYTSYLVFWFGWTIAAWHPFALIIPPIFIGLYVSAARMEERNFEQSPLSADYAAYRKQVGGFFPKLR